MISPRKASVSLALEATTSILPQHEAIIDSYGRFTYSQINDLANQVANGLIKSGIVPGDKIAVSCPNNHYFVAIYFGILKTGAVVVPLNILLTQREIKYHLINSDARGYFCFASNPAIADAGIGAFEQVETCEILWTIGESQELSRRTMDFEEWSKSQPIKCESWVPAREDTAVILYTSGTTGQPKGAELTHANLIENAMVVAHTMGLRSTDRHLVALPLFHSFGQTVQLLAGFLSGCTLVLLERFQPKNAFEMFQQEQISIFVGVPTMYWQLLHYEAQDRYDLQQIATHLRLGVSGGVAMPKEVMTAFEGRFGVTILESYGLSETSPVACFSRPDLPRKVGSIGVPLPFVEMIIADEEGKQMPVDEVGEVLIRGHNIMKGYYKNEEATREAFRDGWFHTGDLGKVDKDGFFYIVDRKKDMINRGGYNVYPREVEEELILHPSISLVAVVGVPDEQYGEEIVAYVVLEKEKKATQEELIKWSKERLATYKYPRRFIFVERLPTTATGKILKRLLKSGQY